MKYLFETHRTKKTILYLCIKIYKSIMTSEERLQKQKELIESLGRYYDKQGFQPIAGRLLGMLIVMDKEMFTFDEIVEELKISKSSASNAIKTLIDACNRIQDIARRPQALF